MKKLILPVVFFLTVIFFLPPKVHAQTGPDCHEVFTKESNSCLKESTKCISSCVDKANDVMSLTVDGGKVNRECQRNVCDPASKTCDDKTAANFRACLDARKAKADSTKEAEAKKETSVKTETEARFDNFLDPREWPNPRDLIYDYLVKEAARFDVRAPGYWEIKPEDFVIKRDTPKWGGGYIWIVEPRTKVWVKAKDQNEYKPFDSNTTVEPGSYIKTGVPVSFWVKGVGLIQLRPDLGVSGMFAVEEINGEISPLLLMGEMEVKYGKPVEEANQKPVDWEQIKFEVRTPNSSVTVSRTHYLVRYDEKENETTVAVLEGKVEVTPNVGKPVTVIPKDGGPGVVVVTQRLSLVRLVVIGMVLAVIIGGVAWFLKKKTKVLYSKKR